MKNPIRWTAQPEFYVGTLILTTHDHRAVALLPCTDEPVMLSEFGPHGQIDPGIQLQGLCVRFEKGWLMQDVYGWPFAEFWVTPDGEPWDEHLCFSMKKKYMVTTPKGDTYQVYGELSAKGHFNVCTGVHQVSVNFTPLPPPFEDNQDPVGLEIVSGPVTSTSYALNLYHTE